MGLVVEVDGGLPRPAARCADERRDCWLLRHGYTVLRFSDALVVRNAADAAYTCFPERKTLAKLDQMPTKQIDESLPHSTAGEGKQGVRTLFYRFLRVPRDLLASQLFPAVRQYCRGNVLDVGGWDFFLILKKKGAQFTRWTTLENSTNKLLVMDDPRFECVLGDGCQMRFADGSFDTVLNIQVLEHVKEPMRMVHEISRVLAPGGHAIFLIPQTAYMHFAPYHYYNFTRFWIQE
ncbi:MAG TPA: methyltransferase domain-containing protein, partial [Polyangiaceae bacterium]